MLKGKLNWVHGLCVVLVALLLVGGLWLFTKEEPEKAPVKGKESEPYLVTLQSTQRMEDPYNDLKVGDILYFYEQSGELGEIVTLRLKDKVTEVYDENAGIYREVVSPQKKTVEVQVRVMGRKEHGKFLVDGSKLIIGETIYPETEKCRVTAKICAIEKIEEGGSK